MHLLFRHVLDMEDPAIFELEDEKRITAFLVLRSDVEFHDHFILVFDGALLRIEIDLHLDLGGDFTAHTLLRNDILEREIADILRKHLHLDLLGLLFLRLFALFGHCCILLKNGSVFSSRSPRQAQCLPPWPIPRREGGISS